MNNRYFLKTVANQFVVSVLIVLPFYIVFFGSFIDWVSIRMGDWNNNVKLQLVLLGFFVIPLFLAVIFRKTYGDYAQVLFSKSADMFINTHRFAVGSLFYGMIHLVVLYGPDMLRDVRAVSVIIRVLVFEGYLLILVAFAEIAKERAILVPISDEDLERVRQAIKGMIRKIQNKIRHM